MASFSAKLIRICAAPLLFLVATTGVDPKSATNGKIVRRVIGWDGTSTQELQRTIGADAENVTNGKIVRRVLGWDRTPRHDKLPKQPGVIEPHQRQTSVRKFADGTDSLANHEDATLAASTDSRNSVVSDANGIFENTIVASAFPEVGDLMRKKANASIVVALDASQRADDRRLIKRAFEGVVGEGSHERRAGVWDSIQIIIVVLLVILVCIVASFAVSISRTDSDQVSRDAMFQADLSSLNRLWGSLLGEISADGDELHDARAQSYEDALDVPDDVEELAAILAAAGIDVSKWGQSLQNLQDELLRGECSLAYSVDTGANHARETLDRRVRLMIVKLATAFPDGLRVLHCVGVTDNHTGQFKAKKQECAKKIEFGDDVMEVLPRMLRNELSLSDEWQNKHLRLVHQDRVHLESGAERGQSFPGLTSRYITEYVVMKVEHLESTNGQLNLPDGSGTFKITDSDFLKDKTRTWKWEPVTGEDFSEVWASK
jgi:hypothetical protein